MLISVYAYGEDRFDLMVDPCKANIGKYENNRSLPTIVNHTDKR